MIEKNFTRLQVLRYFLIKPVKGGNLLFNNPVIRFRQIITAILFLTGITFSGIINAQYCQPLWIGPSCGSSNGDDIINGFQFNNVNNQNIGCPPVDPNFIDFSTNACISVCPGFTYPVTLSPGYALTGNDEYFAIYIDFNGDGIFEPNEFFYMGHSVNGSNVVGSITIPAGSPAMNTRLRVVCESYAVGIPPTNSDACGNDVTYGEAIDYCLEINAAPDINLGPDSEQCGGNRVLDAGGPDSLYQWSDGTSNEVVVASTSGIYSVTVTNTGGCTASASVNVYIKPIPVVNLGPDVTQCGGSVVLDAGSPGDSYVWSDGSTMQTLTVTVTNNYLVTVTDANSSCTASDAVRVTINSVPTLNFGPSIAQCGGTVTLDAENPGSTYLWSDSSTNETLTVTTTGYYTVTVTTTNQCSVSAGQLVNIYTVPVLGPNVALSICSDSTVNLTQIFPDNGYASYTWNTATPTSVGAGSYTITVSSINNCTASAVVDVSFLPEPALGANMTIGVCPGSTIDLTSYYPDTAYASYNWNTPTPTFATAGTYTLTVTNIEGCGNIAVATVVNNPQPNAGPNTIDSICPGTTFDLTSIYLDTGYAGYVWNTTTPTQVSAGIYYLTVTNVYGCTDTAVSQVVNYPVPVVLLPPFHDVCYTTPPFPLTGGAPPGGVYEIDADTTPDSIFNPFLVDIGLHVITYTYTTFEGCTASATSSIFVHPQPFITTTPAPDLCTTTTAIDLNIYFTPPGGFYSGLGVSGHYFYPTLSAPGIDTIVDVYTDTFGCMDTSVYEVTVNPSVHVSLTSSVADFTICLGQTITFNASGAEDYQFFVNDTAQDSASTNNIFSTSTLSNHSIVTVVGSNQCSSDTSEMMVIDVITPPLTSAGPDTTIVLGQIVQLLGNATGATALYYLWSPPTGLSDITVPNPVYAGVDSVSLWFKATDAYGCSDSSMVTINVTIPNNILLPNVITPNGDGKNDVWKLNPKIDLAGSNLVIFNRWGETVYEADNYNNDWGGTYKGTGKALPDGTYYYILKVPEQNNEVYKGAINIISGEAK